MDFPITLLSFYFKDSRRFNDPGIAFSGVVARSFAIPGLGLILLGHCASELPFERVFSGSAILEGWRVFSASWFHCFRILVAGG
jgi:hypothetical protein